MTTARLDAGLVGHREYGMMKILDRDCVVDTVVHLSLYNRCDNW